MVQVEVNIKQRFYPWNRKEIIATFVMTETIVPIQRTGVRNLSENQVVRHQ